MIRSDLCAAAFSLAASSADISTLTLCLGSSSNLVLLAPRRGSVGSSPSSFTSSLTRVDAVALACGGGPPGHIGLCFLRVGRKSAIRAIPRLIASLNSLDLQLQSSQSGGQSLHDLCCRSICVIPPFRPSAHLLLNKSYSTSFSATDLCLP